MGKLLDLPNELLFDIIALCRMASFESMMLTCRRMHLVGQPLIQGYYKHTQWLQQESSSDPRRLQTEVEVLNILSIFGRRPNLDVGFAFSIIEDLRIIWSEEHSRWLQVLYNLKKNHEAAYTQLDRVISAIKHFGWNELEVYTIRAASHRDILPFLEGCGAIWTVPVSHYMYGTFQSLHPAYYDLAALCLFDNLRRLEIDGKLAEVLEWGMPQHFQELGSRSLFPTLQDLHLRGEYEVFNHLHLWLYLPRIRSILIDELALRDRQVEICELQLPP